MEIPSVLNVVTQNPKNMAVFKALCDYRKMYISQQMSRISFQMTRM
jgi:hypothetical protein